MPASPPAAPGAVAVTGASGFVGRRLVARLEREGRRVLRLVRRPARGEGEVEWDPLAGRVDAARLEGSAAVVHLAGESIFALRWTESKKERIQRSRVEGTRALAGALLGLVEPPKVLASASATGWYGDRGEEVVDESSPPGTGFLAETCRLWEAESARAEARMRVVRARFGLVLDPSGGVLAKLLPIARLGLHGPVAGGRQWFPWIALDDLVAALVHAIDTPALAGPVNVVAPDEVRQGEFARTLGRVLHRPAFLPAPAFLVRAAAGRAQAEELLLGGARVRPKRLLESGFVHAMPELEGALASMLRGEGTAAGLRGRP